MIYECLTPEQQLFYEKMTAKQKAYIDQRARGLNRAQAATIAGYGAKNARQAGYLIEKNSAGVREILGILLKDQKAKEIEYVNSNMGKKITALAKQKKNDRTLEVIENADPETAKRIKFYQDRIDGRIKSMRETTKFTAAGAMAYKTVEYETSIEARMRARKELDAILGLNAVVELGNVKMGDITINIVDASKKEKAKVIEGEATKSEEFYEVVKEDDGEERAEPEQ